MESFWGITTYFSYSKNDIRYKNYQIFRENSKKQGLQLITIELAKTNKSFQLIKEKDAEILIQLKSDSVLWQKERFLNIALNKLPKTCKYVCAIDCDIVINDKNWISKSIEALKKHKAIQPFKYAILMKKDKSPANYAPSLINKTIKPGKEEGNFKYSFAHYYISSKKHDKKAKPQAKFIFSFFQRDKINPKLFYWGQYFFIKAGLFNYIRKYIIGSNNKSYYNPGLCWCFRKEVLLKMLFYDRCIVGGGDTVMANAMIGNKYHSLAISRVESLKLDFSNWFNVVYNAVNGSIYYLDSTCYHFWHGYQKRKKHVLRYNILEKNNFDPQNDVKISENQCLEWSTDKSALINDVSKYFQDRDRI
ncbi:MAG: hypothetical protein ABIA04_00595 [Pseudomonadota bacterium]